MSKLTRPTERANGQRLFRKVSLPFFGPVALGNGTQFIIAASVLPLAGGDVLSVSVEGWGSYTFGHFIAATYAAEKLGLLVGDGANVADWINDQLGPSKGRQGSYDKDLLDGGEPDTGESNE